MSPEGEILALLDLWNAAIQSGEPDRVVALYAPDAVLIPTLSDRVRHDHDEMRDYFEQFLALGPRATVEESNVRLWGEIAVHSGLWTFRLASGPAETVRARFTFVYRRIGGRWLIVAHHSSVMPGQP